MSILAVIAAILSCSATSVSVESAKDFVERYSMKEHVDGGWFAEIYRNTESYDKLPERYGQNATRSFGTHICLMLENEDITCFRRLESDELWHFYVGADLLVYVIDEESGGLSTHFIGPREGVFFLSVKRGDYCASRLRTPGENLFSLVGLTVIPGFEFDDFDMPTEEHMLKHYPQHSEVIKRHTR